MLCLFLIKKTATEKKRRSEAQTKLYTPDDLNVIIDLQINRAYTSSVKPQQTSSIFNKTSLSFPYGNVRDVTAANVAVDLYWPSIWFTL